MNPVDIQSPPTTPPEGSRRTAHDRKHSVSRELLLRTLERAGDASVADLTRATGLHENTVRGHLTRLERDGYVRQAPEPSPGGNRGRGRPASRWIAVSADTLHPYAGLATALADALEHSGADAADLARSAGRRWGERLVEERRATNTGADTTDTSTREGLVTIMREQGFAPEMSNGDITLLRCPMLAAAAERSDVVCAVHAGLIEGVARSTGNDDTAPRLLPFATPSACLIHMRAAS